MIDEEDEDTFTCEECGQSFLKGQTDEDMEEEYVKTFPDMLDEGRALVCDECYRELMAFHGRAPLDERN